MRQLLFLAAISVLPAVSESEWTAVSSENFELITTASGGDARRGAEYFEQVRDFFTRVRAQKIPNHLPVTVIVFRNAKEYKPYSANEASAAYFLGDASRDFIVMSGFGDQHKAIAVHEYMHLLVRHMELDLPVWLNEGIAEVYSTLQPQGKKIVVGHVPQGRGIVLGRKMWLKLPHLFSITHDSPEYNEKDRAGVLYAQSWLLTHMLMLDPAYGPKFGAFVAQIASGVGSERALEEVYGKAIPELENDLRRYFQSRTLTGVVFDARLEKLKVGEPRPADPFQVELSLARVTAMLGRVDEAGVRLERLSKEHPDRWETAEALGQLAWRKGDLDTARTLLRKAVDRKPDNWVAYWDYARLAQATESERATVIASLRRVLALNGAHVDAKLMLAEQLFHAQQYRDALVAYSVITSVDASRASRLFLGKAHVLARLEEFDKARAEAEQALKYAKEQSHRQSAESILRFLDRRAELEKQGVRVAQAPEMASESRLELPAQPRPSGEQRPMLPSVQGVLTEVACDGERVRLLLQAGQRQIGFRIMNPDRVVIRNAPGTTMTLTCGKQAPGTLVLIEFEEKAGAADGTMGEVRGLEFLKQR